MNSSCGEWEWQRYVTAPAATCPQYVKFAKTLVIFTAGSGQL